MNKIKGLILKDLFELKAYKKNFLLSIFLYVLIIIMNADNADMTLVGTSMIVFLCSIYALATFSYDEKSKTDKYVLTLGINRKEAIISKYVFVIFSIILGVIIGSIISIVLSFVGVVKMLSFSESLSSILGIVFILSLIHGIQIPCIYKYGAEKGRLQIYLVAMVLFFVFGGVYFLFPNINLDFLNEVDFIIPYIFVLLIMINYYVSYKVSCNIYLKKEL